MIIGIDGSSVRGGGGVSYVVGMLRDAKPEQFGIDRIRIWSVQSTLDALPERSWLEGEGDPLLEGSLAHRTYWQRFVFPRLASECDLVFAPGGTAPYSAPLLVTTSQNILPFDWRELRRFGISRVALRLLILRWTQGRSFSRADGMIFLSDHAERMIRRHVALSGRKVTIPHGIEDRFRYAPRPARRIEDCSPSDPFRLLYVSIVNVYKHQWHVAAAVARLRAAGVPVAIDFVGPAYPPAERRLQRVIEELDPAGEFLDYGGSIPYSELHTHYQSADCFVFASSCENLPNIVIEAMAAGLPIAASLNQPMPEVLGDSYESFDPESPDDIARALDALIQDPERRHALAHNVFEMSKIYSWERCADETLGFMAEVVREHARDADAREVAIAASDRPVALRRPRSLPVPLRGSPLMKPKQFYDVLPIFAQNLACTLQGYRRYRNRFTPHFHACLQKWAQHLEGPVEPLHEIQRKRLIDLVERSRAHVPHYADLPPASTASDPLQAIEETLAQIPVLEKEAYRASSRDFLARNIPTSALELGATAGTTGSPLRLYYTSETLAEEYATVWRMRTGLGINLRDSHLTWGGQVIVPFEQPRPPFWRDNLYGRQRLFSTYHMTPKNLPTYVDAIHEGDAIWVEGYPSAIHLMARAILAEGRPVPRGKLKGVFTSSESLLAFQREDITAAFGAPVFDRYGSTEFAVSMTACREENLHVDMEFCIVEVEPDEETDDYVRGQLLVTGLGNPANPFLRYKIGDVGTRLKAPCPCGRPGDVFADIDGRIEDFVLTPDDRRIGRLDHIFKKLEHVEEAQILQETKQRIEVLFVPQTEFGAGDEKKLMTAIRTHVGAEIDVDLRRVASIPREANGKFRAVKSAVARIDA